MNISDRIKIKLYLKRMSFKELETIKKFVDEEIEKQKKNLLKHK